MPRSEGKGSADATAELVEAPACLQRKPDDVRQRLRNALRAKRDGRRAGGQLRQINAALSTLQVEPVGNLRAAQARLGQTRKKMMGGLRGAGSGAVPTLNTDFIDMTDVPEEVGARPATRSILRAPTE
jgi:hypothetical protein